MTLTLDHANKMIAASLAEARMRGFQPLCVVVLDTGGHAVALNREDGASISRPDIATAKAGGCLSMGFGGRELARRAEKMPSFFSALNGIFPHGIVAVPGGVLVRNAAGDLLGAIGISGDTSDNDEICAVAGVEAAGLVPETGA